MKKILTATFLLGALILITAGCSSGKTGSPENDTPSAPIMEETVSAGTSLPAEKGTLGKITVADFSAGWCMPCQQFKPEFASAAKKLKGKAEFVTIDVDESGELASAYDITSVPTVIIFDKEGKVVWRTSGYMDAEEVIEAVTPYIDKK